MKMYFSLQNAECESFFIRPLPNHSGLLKSLVVTIITFVIASTLRWFGVLLITAGLSELFHKLSLCYYMSSLKPSAFAGVYFEERPSLYHPHHSPLVTLFNREGRQTLTRQKAGTKIETCPSVLFVAHTLCYKYTCYLSNS